MLDSELMRLRQLALVAVAARASARALIRRRLRGPVHPAWPLPYELAIAMIRAVAGSDYGAARALLRAQVSPIPRSLVGQISLTRDRLGGVPVEIHTPRSFARGAPTLLYLHGGGFVTCSPACHRDVIARIVAVTGARCIAPDYRLAPEHPFPAALDDCVAVWRALLAAGAAPRSLFVAGDSSGGGLSLSLLLALREAGEPLPRAGLLLSPWVDLSPIDEALTRPGRRDYLTPEMVIEAAAQYAGREALSHPSLSPLHADLTGLPPLLIQTGEWELFCEQNRRFAEQARRAGVSVRHEIEPGMLHGFVCFAGILPQGRRALASIGRYVKALTASDEQLGREEQLLL